MSLAADHEVVAVDLNPVQIAYARKRLAGEIVQRGQAERLLSFGRSLAPVAGWSQRILREFFGLSDPSAQMDYWNRHLNTRRFRAGFDFLLSGPILSLAYSRPLVGSLPDSFGPVLRRRMERSFSRHLNRDNSYARALLLGEFPPPWPGSRDSNVRLACEDAAAFLESEPRGSFEGISLSNILDGASEGYAARLMAAVRRAAAPSAVIVLRSFREPSVVTATNRAADDRSMIWGVVEVRPVAEL